MFYVNRGSYISVHVLFSSLNELGKRDKGEACRKFYIFFVRGFINSMIQELRSTNCSFHLSHHIKIN